MIQSYKRFGPVARLEKSGAFSLNSVNMRDYACDQHGSVDDRPYGGGDGMVLRPEPIVRAIKDGSFSRVVYTSPSGKPWKQTDAARYVRDEKSVLIICGRFSGVDQRVIDQYVDEEVSFGDFVLSGGELPALMMTDSIVRLIPGALGHKASAHDDSFSPGFEGLLEHPVYTRPPVFEGQEVPDVLLSGNHQAIQQWKKHQSLEKTKRYRQDLLRKKVQQEE